MMLYPPKFCSFKNPTDPSFPTYLTTGTNMVSKIDEINQNFILLNKAAINQRNTQGGKDEMFGMHGYGMRLLGKGRREHRWGMWFEKEDDRKLHLKHEWRAAVLHRVQLHFIHNTEW